MPMLATLASMAPDWTRMDGDKVCKPPSVMDEELRRILALHRRPPVDCAGSPRALALVELMTERLSRKDGHVCDCQKRWGRCIDKLLPQQAWTLYEAPLAEGLFGVLSCGSGKTLVDILVPMVMPFKPGGMRTAVLFIPPGLRDQFYVEYQRIREHFVVPSLVMEGKRGFITPGAPVLHVIPYSLFSRPESTALLESIAPDLIIADEGHHLRSRDSARGHRFLRYFVNHPTTMLCIWSGTLVAKSIRDFAHLSALSLGMQSPLPVDPDVVGEWAAAVDPAIWTQSDIGALEALIEPGETLHQAVHRRIVETFGVVATKGTDVSTTINLIQRHPPKMPSKLATLLEETRKTWVRPDGEELIDVLSVANVCRQLACGFYYRWVFPRGEPEELILRWFKARKFWHKELREKLKFPREHFDSPMLVANAAIRYYAGTYRGDLPVWKSEAWPAWNEIKDAVEHETAVVWVDEYLAEDAAKWANHVEGGEYGIVWYEHDAFGQKVARLGKLPLYGGGKDAEAGILAEKGKRSIVASIKAHGTGRDGLQRVFRRQLVANPPSGGDAWEQLMARLHRIGQDADEIDTYVYRHSPEMRDAVDRAVRLAKFIEGISGTHQKLLSANCDFLV